MPEIKKEFKRKEISFVKITSPEEARKQDYSNLKYFTKEWLGPKDYKDYFKNKKSVTKENPLVLALHKGKVVGYARTEKLGKGKFNNEVVNIKQIETHPDYQRLGIGKKLVSMIASHYEEVEKGKVSKTQLVVYPTNPKIKNMLGKLSFEEVKQTFHDMAPAKKYWQINQFNRRKIIKKNL